VGQYIQLTEPLYDYLLAQRSNATDEILNGIRTETLKLGDASRMAISLEQGNFLTFLVAAIKAKNAVEVGTFTGSSSVSIARGLSENGKLHCFDHSQQYTSIAKEFWKKAGLEAKIELHLGDAKKLIGEFQPKELIDFVFIDADKGNYDFYFETLFPFVRSGGVIVFDNMLRGGDVIKPFANQSEETRGLVKLNAKLAKDPRLSAVLVPIADGLQLCLKK
jgi:caffeoyl-CoA O-methyltransferase